MTQNNFWDSNEVWSSGHLSQWRMICHSFSCGYHIKLTTTKSLFIEFHKNIRNNKYYISDQNLCCIVCLMDMIYLLNYVVCWQEVCYVMLSNWFMKFFLADNLMDGNISYTYTEGVTQALSMLSLATYEQHICLCSVLLVVQTSFWTLFKC